MVCYSKTDARLSFKSNIEEFFMENLKSLFGAEALTFDELQERLNKSQDKVLLANLRSGRYVAKDKFDKLDKRYKKLSENNTQNTDILANYENLQKEHTELQTKYTELQNANTENEKMRLISGMNVNPKFIKFVKTEVDALTNENKDFSTALKEYLKSNRDLLNGAKGNYVNLEQGTTPKTSTQKMNDFIRGVKK